MAASVSFLCDACSNFKDCDIKPENSFKTMDSKSGWCFVSEKERAKVENVVHSFGKKKGRRKIKLNKKREVENGNP
jgi:hypothetical protein